MPSLKSFAVAAVVAAGAFVQSAHAFDLTFPSGSSYWVSNATNEIRWTATPSDPSPISIMLINSANASFINGNFGLVNAIPSTNGTASIAPQIFPAGDGYQLLFVNSSNFNRVGGQQIYYTSPTFAIREIGTSPAPVTGATGTTGSSTSGTTGPSGGASSTASSVPSASASTGAGVSLKGFGAGAPVVAGALTVLGMAVGAGAML